MAESEVARIRREIEQEYEAAARGLNGFAITARHEFIRARYRRIGALQQKLAVHVGEEQSLDIVAEINDRMIPAHSKVEVGEAPTYA